MILIPHSGTTNEVHHGVQTAEQGRGRRQAEYYNNDINWVKKEITEDQNTSGSSSSVSLHGAQAFCNSTYRGRCRKST